MSSRKNGVLGSAVTPALKQGLRRTNPEQQEDRWVTQVPGGRYRVHPRKQGPCRDSRAGQKLSGPRPGPREATQGLAPKAPSRAARACCASSPGQAGWSAKRWTPPEVRCLARPARSRSGLQWERSLQPPWNPGGSGLQNSEPEPELQFLKRVLPSQGGAYYCCKS